MQLMTILAHINEDSVKPICLKDFEPTLKLIFMHTIGFLQNNWLIQTPHFFFIVPYNKEKQFCEKTCGGVANLWVRLIF